MMDVGTIKRLSAQAGRKAAKARKTPHVFTQTELGELLAGRLDALKRVPNIGDYDPPCWEFVEDHFVDSSGFGAPGEPALTIEQFIRVVAQRPRDHGYAIHETGQFQIYIGEFAPMKGDADV